MKWWIILSLLCQWRQRRPRESLLNVIFTFDWRGGGLSICPHWRRSSYWCWWTPTWNMYNFAFVKQRYSNLLIFLVLIIISYGLPDCSILVMLPKGDSTFVNELVVWSNEPVTCVFCWFRSFSILFLFNLRALCWVSYSTLSDVFLMPFRRYL